LGRRLYIEDSGHGAGTDAVFAACFGKSITMESFGLTGSGFHSSGNEYVNLDSIVPRLYLMVRLIMDRSNDL
jgi:glutamate carboxypeptidase